MKELRNGGDPPDLFSAPKLAALSWRSVVREADHVVRGVLGRHTGQLRLNWADGANDWGAGRPLLRRGGHSAGCEIARYKLCTAPSHVHPWVITMYVWYGALWGPDWPKSYGRGSMKSVLSRTDVPLLRSSEFRPSQYSHCARHGAICRSRQTNSHTYDLFVLTLHAGAILVISTVFKEHTAFQRSSVIVLPCYTNDCASPVAQKQGIQRERSFQAAVWALLSIYFI